MGISVNKNAYGILPFSYLFFKNYKSFTKHLFIFFVPLVNGVKEKILFIFLSFKLMF